MSYARRLLVFLALFAFPVAWSCNQPDADPVTIGLALSLPDALPDRHTVPLDVTDGFPLRIKVCSPNPTVDGAPLEGTLQAHVWLSGESAGAAPATGMSTTVTDTMVALESENEPSSDPRCPGSAYSALVTLNAPGPGPVLVQAELDGQIVTFCAVVGPQIPDFDLAGCVMPGSTPLTPLIQLSPPVLLPLWNGTVPRYTLCAQTAASKGTVTLTSFDPTLLSTTQAPLSGTLIPGTCGTPLLCGGPGSDAGGSPYGSHVNFDVALTPPGSTAPPTPFVVVATLAGMPATQTTAEDVYLWSATQTIGANPPPVTLDVESFQAQNEQLPTGELFAVMVHATQAGAPGGGCSDAGVTDAGTVDVEGLTVAFATTTTGVTFSPATSTTDSTGQATSYVVVPYSTQVTAVASAGGFLGQMTLPKAPEITLSPPGITAQMDMDAGLSAGELFQVTTSAALSGVADGGQIEGLAVAFATTATGVTFSPASAITNSMGVATSYVTVPYQTAVATLVSAPGVAVPAVISNNPSAPLITLSQPTLKSKNIGLPTGEVFEVTTRATLSGASSVPVEGLSITFAGTSATSGSSVFSPATVLTGTDGTATSYVVVPYDSQFLVEVSGGGAVSTQMLMTVPTITFSNTMCAMTNPPAESTGGSGSSGSTSSGAGTGGAGTGGAGTGGAGMGTGGAGASISDAGTGSSDAGLPVSLPTGQVFAVWTTATLTDSNTPIEGLSIAFTSTPASGMATPFSPAAVLTDAAGRATSYVVVPYGSALLAELSGGGTVATCVTAAPVIKLSATVTSPNYPDASAPLPAPDPMDASIIPPTPLTLVVTATANSMPIPGLTLTFTTAATAEPSTMMGVVTPATGTLVTDSLGMGTFYVEVPASVNSATIVISGGGAIIQETAGHQ